MGLWRRVAADLAQPGAPPGREERTFLLAAPVVVVVIAALTDRGTVADVLLLAPAMLAFVGVAFATRFRAEVFAAVVLISVGAAISRSGNVEPSYFLVVLMVLYTSWNLGSVARAGAIAAVSTAGAWIVADHVIPADGILWTPWATACIFMYVLGRTLHRQRTLIVELEEARQALATQAVVEERRRMARELHDLAGHTLAAVLLHLTGARHVLRRDLDEADRALVDAEAVGRSSLDQIREAVATLRADERGTDPALAGSEDLPLLIDSYRRAGLDVHAALDAPATPGPLGTAVHRIVREALANVARHAPGNRAEVCVAASSGHLRLVVADHGRPAPPAGDHRLQFGLIGMAERARAVGGTFSAGPTEDGWQVAATLPLTAPRPEAAAP